MATQPDKITELTEGDVRVLEKKGQKGEKENRRMFGGK